MRFAADARWPVYVRTGTPTHGLPLQLAALAREHTDVTFVMGRSGATDFSGDGPHALALAANLVADSAHVEWPTRLVAAAPELFGHRVVFTTDAPFADPDLELARATEAGLPSATRAAVLGGNLAKLRGL